LGVVKRQTISGTIFTYLGVVFGFVTTALIFPEYLSTEEIGLIGIFLSYSYILAQLATLGTGRITIVMFPYFKDKDKNHNGFFYLMIMISVAGLLITFAGFYFLQKWLVEYSKSSSALFSEHINYIYPLTIFTLAFMVFDSFNTALFNAVRGIFLKEFVQRLLILFFIVFFIFKWITFEQYLPLFVLATALPALFMILALLRNPEFRIGTYASGMIREKSGLMASLGFYGILIGFSGTVITNIDRIMVERIMGLGPTGVYTTMAFFSTMVIIPSRALLKISDPVIAQSWKDSDINNVRKNYYNSTISQFLIGSLILVGIWVNIGNILEILPPAFAEGKYVVLFIGLAFLVDMSSGTATYILANSAYYKYQTYFIMGFVLMIIVSNYFFIPVWGLSGAAISTMLSKIAINIMRHQLIYRKFKLQPYTWKFLTVIVISTVSYLAGYILPVINNVVIDVMIRSTITGVLFIVLALALKVSPEINERYNWLKGKILK
jgi:O-antigen/teichoic acid export membrane protein